MNDPFAALRLDGRVLVVTGSTQGLGAAIARRAAALGAAGIVVSGRDRARGETVAASLPCEALFVEADLAVVDDCRRVVAACDERFGRLDGLVNAAGLSSRGTLDDTSVELWDRLFAINARAPFLLIQHAARVAIAAPRPCVLPVTTTTLPSRRWSANRSSARVTPPPRRGGPAAPRAASATRRGR